MVVDWFTRIDLKNNWNIFGLMEVSLPKTEGKAHDAYVFTPFLMWIPPSIPKISQRFPILLNAIFDFDVSVAIDVANCALPGKVMYDKNGRYIRKLNYFDVYNIFLYNNHTDYNQNLSEFLVEQMSFQRSIANTNPNVRENNVHLFPVKFCWNPCSLRQIHFQKYRVPWS